MRGYGFPLATGSEMHSVLTDTTIVYQFLPRGLPLAVGSRTNGAELR